MMVVSNCRAISVNPFLLFSSSIHVFVVGSDSWALPLLLFYVGSQTLVFLLVTYGLVALNKLVLNRIKRYQVV